MLIYVAGPYSHGDVAANVARAIQVGHEVMDAGHAPIVPHLSHFSHLQRQRPYEEWLKMDFELLKVCECLLRLEGVSSGADREVTLANERGIPIVWQDGDKWKYGNDRGRLLSMLNLVAMDYIMRDMSAKRNLN